MKRDNLIKLINNINAERKEVISMFKSKILQLHTTRSWDFMGLSLTTNTHEATPLQLAYGDNIIVGVIDSGP